MRVRKRSQSQGIRNNMTTFEIWIDASLDIMKNNLDLLRELRKEENLDGLIIQGYSLKKNIDSFVDFLEKRKKFG